MSSVHILEKIKGGLIVSCQALEGEPLYGGRIMPRMAAAKQGGAVAIRANGKEDILQIKEEVQLPVIGIKKRVYENSDVFITPTLKEIQEVVEAGADIVAIDGTNRKRPDSCSLNVLIKLVKQQFPQVLVMADISTIEEGIMAADFGADMIATTLSGYTPYSQESTGPDLELIKKLSSKITLPIIAEGRISTPSDAYECMRSGAWSVVVGSAITRPHEITEKFVIKLKG